MCEFFVFFITIANAHTINVYASNNTLSLHEQTKINNVNNEDYVSGQENYINYENDAPSITVLTHGFGVGGYSWSNNQSNPSQISYNSSSLIDKIFNKLDGNATLYVANGTTQKITISNDEYYYNYGMTLKKYSYNNYRNSSSGTFVSSIDDMTGHIILVFNSSIADETNQFVYKEFEHVLDTISLQYKNLTGKMPKFNLVGHSRGGITNIMYASEHPYNVSSIISLGTPYNGSKLGQLEALLDFMGYVDENYEISKPGVKDILTESVNINIRNSWNNAYQLDGVDIDVIAYGSSISIGLVEELIDDVDTNPLFVDYQEQYGGLLDVLKVVIDVANEYPNFTSFILNLIDGVVGEINESKGENLYADLFSYIDPKLNDKTTYEEVSEIVQLINIVNNEIVIMDDLFIDLDSQLGFGFSDGIDYLGFTRYLKTFKAEDYTSNRAVYAQPGIVHNLEPMNDYYTTAISNSLKYTSITNISIYDDSEYVLSVECGDIINFQFNPRYTANRIFEFENSKIFLYSYDSSDNRILVDTYEDELTTEFNKNTNYVISVLSKEISNYEVNFYISDIIGSGSYNKTISPGDEVVLKVQSDIVGYYLISIDNAYVLLKNEVEYDDNRYYAYLDGNGEEKYIYLSNLSSSEISFTLILNEPTTIDVDNQLTINSNYKIVKCLNDSNYSQSYQLTLEWSSESEYATFVKNGVEINVTVENSGTLSIYTFVLDCNETCYVIYSSSNSSIISKLRIDQNMMRWKIDGIIYDTLNIILPRSGIYNVEVVYYSTDGIEQSYDSTYAYRTSSSNFTFSNNILNIVSNALIGNEIDIFPVKAPSYMLTITIGPTKNGTINIENFEDVIVSFTGENADRIKWKINGTVHVSSGNMYYITSLLPAEEGITTVELLSATYNGVEFLNNNYFNINSKTVNNLYEGGKGTSSDPYLIGCARHLDNIRICPSKYYRQTTDITMNLLEYWTPISSFSGFYEGNNLYINMLTIKITTNSMEYGFFGRLSGTIQNVIFKNACIYTEGLTSDSSITDKMYVGVVAGFVYSSGKVINCSVMNGGSVDVQLYQSLVGGLVGLNKGTITDCYADLILSVSGRAGGIAGENGGTITGSAYYGKITYHYNDDNGIIGGIVGYNESTGNIVNCLGDITFVWQSPGKNDNIYPYIGALIGCNNGTYSNCTVLYDDSGVVGIPTKVLFVVTHDQEKYCFAEDDGRVGYNK